MKKNKTRRNPNFRYQKTIIFDLDETLIHCNDNNSDVDTYVKITFPNGESVDVLLYLILFKIYFYKLKRQVSKFDLLHKKF